jgi:putative ATPase
MNLPRQLCYHERMELFASNSLHQGRSATPLAARMRPTSLDEFIGQTHLLGPGKLLREMIEARELRSLILWGPPGTGKTTLALILARSAGAVCVHFSAITAGVKELKKIVDEAQRLHRLGQATVLFVDEIHHFNKAQQDNFLPHVEHPEGLQPVQVAAHCKSSEFGPFTSYYREKSEICRRTRRFF